MRKDDVSALTGTFFARVPPFDGTGHDRFSRAPSFPAANANFTRIFAMPFGTALPDLPPRAPTPPSQASVALSPTCHISTRTNSGCGRCRASCCGLCIRTWQGCVGVFLSGLPYAARSVPSSAFDCRTERMSSPNACPDGTHESFYRSLPNLSFMSDRWVKPGKGECPKPSRRHVKKMKGWLQTQAILCRFLYQAGSTLATHL